MGRATLVCLTVLLGAFAVAGQDAPTPDSVVAEEDGRVVVEPLLSLDYKRLSRSSGLARWQGAWWSHNDSRDGPFLYQAEDLTFKSAHRHTVTGARTDGWADMAILGGDLLACDIGDPRRERDDLKVYRLAWDATEVKPEVTALCPIAYPDGKHHATAAVAIGDVLHVITRDRRVYRFPGLKDGERAVGEFVGSLEVDERVAITGADYDAEAGKLVLISNTRVFVYGDTLTGKPERSVRIYAEQCESVCLHEGALLYGNRRGEVYRVNDFLASEYTSLLPTIATAALPVGDETFEPSGTGKAWLKGAHELKLANLREGEYLRWMICGAYLMLAGHFQYDSFSSSSAAGDRLGTGLVVMLGRERTDFPDGAETHLWLGDNGVTGVDAWSLDPEKLSLEAIPGLKSAGRVEGGRWLFEYAVPLTEVLGEGKLPESCLVNVLGFNLHGRDEPSLCGESIITLRHPYIWADAKLTR